jgi:nucleoside-diphosphate-sugar epimerase
MSETVLITGGSGFIGTHLTQALLGRGDRVVNFDMAPPSGPMAWLLGDQVGQVPFVEGAVEDWPSLVAACHRHAVTQIAHLASPIDTDYLNRRPKVALDAIIVGTVNALETTRSLGLKRLLYFSSIGVLPTRQYEPIDCNHPVILAGEGPGSGAYGAGKLAGEALCFAYQKSYGVDFVALRPSAAYGFTTRNLIYLPQFIDGALRGKAVHFTHGGSVPRDYTNVTDIAGVAAAALAVPAERLRHRVFYAASGQPLVTAAETAEMVRELIPSADLSIRPEHDEYDKLEVCFRGVLDMKPVEEQLGYKVRYTDLRAGIADNVQTHSAWLRSQGITPEPTRTP